MRSLLAGLGFVAVCVFVACSSSSTGTNNSSSGSSSGGPSRGGTPISTADCDKRCKAKATACEAPAGQADQPCSQLCGSSPTTEQLTCLEAKTCQELAN